jgi:AAA domain-containing protein
MSDPLDEDVARLMENFQEPDPDAAYQLKPTDWEALLREGIPETDYLDKPYLIRGARIWIWGATGSAKSLWALWVAARLSRRGVRVAYFSEENPLTEDLRRLALLRPSPESLLFFHRTGIDLADPRWGEAMLKATIGCELVVFDSWTDCWRGDENSNEDVRDFDAAVMKPLQAQGATPLVIHHIGHPQMFSNRKGAAAGRGASSLGQKADLTLDFRGESDGAFTIIYGKPRIGGERQPDRTFQVVDTADGIDVVEVGSERARAVLDLAATAVEAILTAPRGYLTTTELRAAIAGAKDYQTKALALIEDDDRVRVAVRKVTTSDGKQRDSKVWEPGRWRGAVRMTNPSADGLLREGLLLASGRQPLPTHPLIEGRMGSGVENRRPPQPIRDGADGLRMGSGVG